MYLQCVQSLYRAVMLLLLCTCVPVAPGAVLVPPGVENKHEAVNMVLSGIFNAARKTADNALCDSADKLGAIQFATEGAANFFTEVITMTPDIREHIIKPGVKSVLENKMCTDGKFIAPVASLFKPKDAAAHKPCGPSKDVKSAVKVHLDDKGNIKADTPFTKDNFKKLFPSCNCEMVKYISAGVSGVVFLVKVGNDQRAMKITRCGKMQAEIYAQEKVAAAPWAIKTHGWGRSVGDKPDWEYYIMDLIGATVDAAVKAVAVSSEQLREVMRLALEAAKDLHEKYDLAHSDLKLDNLAFMADDDKTVRLIDFGQAAPVTSENAIAAYNDFWRIFEGIATQPRHFPEGATPLYNILTLQAAKQIFDGKSISEAKNVKNDFPKKKFFDEYLHGLVMTEFVKLNWIAESAKGKPTSVLNELFTKSKLPVVA